MPVTIKTAPHEANEFDNPQTHAEAHDFFKRDASFKDHASKILGSSFRPGERTQYRSNGFVNTVTDAYNYHYNLIIRPDDVWIAIISQLGFHINAHPEEFRHRFVAHDKKRELIVIIPVTELKDINWDSASAEMADLLDENLVDKELKNWILPTFSTTTTVDRTVSAMLMMASMKSYFDYTFLMRCGIPSVTLDGTKEDWLDIQSRLAKLDSWDDKTRAWKRLLHPIIAKFVAAFDGEVDADFWGHIAHPNFFGSGSHTLGGWITAFCVFTEKGKFNGDALVNSWDNPDLGYVLDGVTYPIIGRGEIPSGSAEVDALIIDQYRRKWKSLLIAGNMGLNVVQDLGQEGDTVQNLPMWCCCLKKGVVQGEISQ